jgi:hypothetical protein
MRGPMRSRVDGRCAALLALAGVGCLGTIDAGPARERGYEGPVTCEVPVAVEAPMRRLSRVEYDHVVADLLGTSTRLGAAFPPDDGTIGFEVGVGVSDALARDYLDAAEALAAEAALDLAALDPTLARCTAGAPPTGTAGEACAAEFVSSFGRRAYRRPLTADERTELVGIFRSGRDLASDPAAGFGEGIELVVNAVLVSPHFLYRMEPTPEGARPGDVVPVEGYALASRLSFFLWRSMPDDELLDAAEAGELTSADDVEAQARRMIEDPRFERSHGDFFRQWLGLDRLRSLAKDTAVYPMWNDDVRDALAASLEASLDEAMETGSLDDLVRGGFAYVDETSAPLFGVTIPSGARPARGGLYRVPVPAGERAGLFTHPALLALLGKANQSDPIHRGVFVRTRLLCGVLAPPPGDVDLTAPELDPGLTTRERFDAHRDEPRCAGCHQRIDPIGYGFEHYDGIGRFRADEGGLAVDASGDLYEAGDASGPFDGAIELSDRLAESDTFHACVAAQMFRFASGRVETRADGCTTGPLRERFAASGYDLRELMVALTQSDDFLHRRVGAAPETP